MLPGMQAELVVPDCFRLLAVMVGCRSLGMQIELVSLDGCRSLSRAEVDLQVCSWSCSSGNGM